jgi:hypothetical protein
LVVTAVQLRFPFFWTMMPPHWVFLSGAATWRQFQKIGKSHYIYQITTIYELVTHLAKTFPSSCGKRNFVATFINFSHSTLSGVIESSTHSSSALFNDSVVGWVDIFFTVHEYNLCIDLWRKDTDRRKMKYSEKPLPMPSTLSQTLYRLAWNRTRAFAMRDLSLNDWATARSVCTFTHRVCNENFNIFLTSRF